MFIAKGFELKVWDLVDVMNDFVIELINHCFLYRISIPTFICVYIHLGIYLFDDCIIFLMLYYYK